MTTPCEQEDTLKAIKADTEKALELIGHPPDPIAGKPATGLTALVLGAHALASRVDAIETAARDASRKRQDVVAQGVKVALLLLAGAASAKVEAIGDLLTAIVR